MAESISPETTIGFLTLAVADLERSLAFYTNVIGFKVLTRTDKRVVLGADEAVPLLVLETQEQAVPWQQNRTGLYHFAILVPNRVELARSLYRLAETHYRLDGSADHLVSEALYLSDPEGNGIEIYRDRPRSEWTWGNGRVRMASDPLDIRGILAELVYEPGQWHGLHPQTIIGHMHLQVADIAQAEAFYSGVLGFDVVASMPSALFVSAGGYHHHIGMNIWHSRNAPRPPANMVGLRFFTITIPDETEKERIMARLQAAKVAFEQYDGAVLVTDPSGNGLRLTVGRVPAEQVLAETVLGK
jgi:catechol 2,3-dioxygenase